MLLETLETLLETFEMIETIETLLETFEMIETIETLETLETEMLETF